jgi:hypothetical protein
MKILRQLPPIALLVTAACADLQTPPARPGGASLPTVSTVQGLVDPVRTRYLCDTGETVVVEQDGDTLRLSGLPRGEETLGRDAGGLTPQQAVFSGATLRVELGLGSDGREMVLQSLVPPQVMSCKAN